MSSIGTRIKQLRESLNLSQSDLAAKMRVHHTYISSIERDKQVPSDMFLALMAFQFGVSEQWLRTGEGPMRPPAQEEDLRPAGEAHAEEDEEENKDNNSIGARIRYLRESLRLSQSELAAKMRVHHTYISALERNKQVPSDMFLALMALQFGVSEEWLRTGEGPMRASPAPETQRPAIRKEEEEDKDLLNILNDIKLFWKSVSPEIRTWFKVHFYRTFPEIEECKKSVEEQSASNIA